VPIPLLKKSKQPLSSLLVALAVVSGCEPAGPGLVVLSPDVARVLIDLELAGSVTGADDRSRTLPGLGQATSLGALDDRAADRVVGLEPDLVLGLAGELERGLAAELAARGVRVELFDPRSMDEVVGAIRRLGELVGRQERAYELTRRMLLDVTRTAVLRDGKPRLTIAWVIDRDPLTVVGGNGLLHQVLELAGAENVLHGMNDSQVTLDESGLAALRYDAIVDAAGGETPPAGDGTVPTLELAPDLAALPAFDVTRRVRILHELLYPAEGP
jgi:iron complex transport system substrate-binding protein